MQEQFEEFAVGLIAGWPKSTSLAELMHKHQQTTLTSLGTNNILIVGALIAKYLTYSLYLMARAELIPFTAIYL